MTLAEEIYARLVAQAFVPDSAAPLPVEQLTELADLARQAARVWGDTGAKPFRAPSEHDPRPRW